LSTDNTICMIEFLGSRKIQKEKMNSLSAAEKIREEEKGQSLNHRLETLISKKFEETGVQEKITSMNFMLEEMAEKMDQIMIMSQSNCREKINPSARKIRVKEMITMMLNQHGQLSAPQLCGLLNLSRTRCSEYLKEMEKKGVLESELNCRKRFYRIRQ